MDKEFIRPPEAPVFEPTTDEFQDPVAYICKIRPVAEQVGICKIRPPSNWQPPFAVDIDRFRFTPRVQRLNELEATTRIKLNFLEHLAKFWELQGVPLKIPSVERKYLDLYCLHKAVQDEGGFDTVCKDRKWPKIADRLCYQPLRAIANTLRQHYEKILFPYDIFLAGTTTDNKGDGDKAAKISLKSEPCSPGAVNANKKELNDSITVKKVDFSLNNELKKLQFFGAGPKTALPDVICIAEDSDLSDSNDSKSLRRRVRCKRQSAQQAICRICNKPGSSEDLLICDGCNDAYHNDCLVTPLHEMPRGDWRCSKCLARECSKSSEVYGFEQGKREYTLQSFGEMADHFKLQYFGTAIHNVPCTLVEKEFWRLVNSIEEEVVVEYGADYTSMDCGSGFPTENTRHLFHDDDEYIRSPWNLNNLPVLKKSVLHYINAEISGMKVPWCYVGMVFSCFAWHIEDHWNYSINYLHWGEPKTWYAVPSSKAELFEEVMMRNAPELFEQSPDLLHQLTTIMNPHILMEAGVPIVQTDQQAGEFVITFPRAYHSGFNQGYNFAEAVNFSLADWLPMGRACIENYRLHHRQCVFSHDEVVCRMASLAAGSLDLTLSVMVYRDMLSMIKSEKKLRKQLLSKGTVIAEKEAFELLPDDERQCIVCKTTCFLSAVTCSCSEGKLVCLHHTDQLCKCSASQHCLRYRYTLDELLTLIGRLKESHQEFEHWAQRAKCALDASDTKRLDLPSFKAFIAEAQDQQLPTCPLLESLMLVVEEAEKCSAVVQQMINNKVCTRQSETGESRYAVKLTMDQLEGFYKQIATLPCIITEQEIVKDLLNKIHHFQSQVECEVKADPLNITRLEKLLEFEIPRDIDVPEMATLRQAVQQAKWVEDVHTSLLPGSLMSIDIHRVRQLIEAGLSVGHHMSCERAMSDLQQLLTASDTCEQKARDCLSARPPRDADFVASVIEESKMFSLSLPSIVSLTEGLKSAKCWTSQVDTLLADSKLPCLETVDNLLSKGREIPVFLQHLAELESRSVAGHAWLDRTSQSFLISKSHSLLKVVCPRTDIVKSTEEKSTSSISQIVTSDQTALMNSLRQAGQCELSSMLQLRETNRQKLDEAGATFCICQRVRSGTMVQCQLCRNLFHDACVSYTERLAGESSKARHSAAKSVRTGGDTSAVQGRTKPVDEPYFCRCCVRSRRPSFADLLSILVSLQKLTVWLPEGTAIQLLADRAVRWLEQVRLALSTDEVAAVQLQSPDSPQSKRTATSCTTKQVLAEKTLLTLDKLMVEGDLLEVSIDEKISLREVLNNCSSADYSQVVYGFPDVLLEITEKKDAVKRVKRRNVVLDKKSDKVPRRKKQATIHKTFEENSEEICSAQKCLRPSGDDIAWVQCDKCQLWFHFRCIGVNTISEHDEYICAYCTTRCPKSSIPDSGKSSSSKTESCAKSLAPSSSVASSRRTVVGRTVESSSESDSDDDSDDSDDDDEDGDEEESDDEVDGAEDEHMRAFYDSEFIDEPVDTYIIRTKSTNSPTQKQSPHSHTNAASRTNTRSPRSSNVIVLE